MPSIKTNQQIDTIRTNQCFEAHSHFHIPVNWEIFVESTKMIWYCPKVNILIEICGEWLDENDVNPILPE